MYVFMADAAFAANIPPGFQIAAGYYGGPAAYHVWPRSDWGLFPGYRLPIWVGGEDGAGEGQQAVEELANLGVPAGCLTVLDMEARKDDTYVAHFGSALYAAGYKTWVYGSYDTLFGNPPLNGYWVADYTTRMAEVRQIMQSPSVRAVQYAADQPPGFDESMVKQWTEGEMWHG